MLVDFAVALASEGEASARAIMDSIEPEATAVRPAASHVMGAALELIDSWFGNPAQVDRLRLASIARWPGKAHRIANDLLVLGRTSRAFDSHESIIMRHGGELLMHGAALAVAAAIRLYSGGISPLTATLERYQDFFDLFGTFDGYVQHFLLQDLVDERTQEVRFFDSWTDFDDPPIPTTAAEYLTYAAASMDFLDGRRARMDAWVAAHVL